MRKEQALLTRGQFERELNYDAALSVARRMLVAGLISRAEFVRIDAILREKFSPVWGGLYHSVACLFARLEGIWSRKGARTYGENHSTDKNGA